MSEYSFHVIIVLLLLLIVYGVFMWHDTGRKRQCQALPPVPAPVAAPAPAPAVGSLTTATTGQAPK